MTQFKNGDKVIIKEPGAFEGMEGIISSAPSATIKGPGVDLDVPEEHQRAIVQIMGALNVFVHPKDLQLA